MAFPQVGIEALMKDDDFKKGLDGYLKGTDEMTDKSEKAGKKLGGLGDTIAKLGGIMAGVFAVTKIVGFFKESVAAAAEEEQGIVKLGQAVRNTGADWDTASSAIEGYLASELKRTALDDGDGREAIQKLTESTGDYKRALELMGLTQDLARAKDMDLAMAADLVGKVAAGNTSALTRYGIVLEDGATATEALAEMQARFGGQAEAFGGTYEGAMAKWQTATGNLKETVGGALLPVLSSAVNVFIDIAERAIPWVQTAMEALGPVFDWMIGVVQSAVAAFGGVSLGFDGASGAMAAMGVIWNDVMTTISAIWNTVWPQLQAVFGPIVEDITRIIRNLAADAQTFIIDKFATVKAWFDENMPLIQATISTVLAAISAFWDEHGVAILGLVTGLWENIKTIIDTAINAVLGVIKTVMLLITGDWAGAWEEIKGVFSTIWDGIKSVVMEKLGSILKLFGTDLPTILSKIKTFGEDALSAIKKPFTTAYDWLVETWGKLRGFVTGIFDNIKIKTPHFSINWREVFGVSIPVGVDVQWYGSGVDRVFTEPTLIGVGERGAERVQVTPVGGGAGSGSGAQVNLGGITVMGGISGQIDIDRIGDLIVQRVQQGLARA